MRIGIDISQICYEGTGVARYVRSLVLAILREPSSHEFILFGASLRKRQIFEDFFTSCKDINPRVTLRTVPVPPVLLEILWNRLHMIPVEWLIGSVDVFWSSDWTQPPLRNARGITTIHDMTYVRFPREMASVSSVDVVRGRFVANIVAVQKRRMHWVKKECSAILCDSEVTKHDVFGVLQVPVHRLFVVYPGIDETI